MDAAHEDLLRGRGCALRPPFSMRELEPRPVRTHQFARRADRLADVVALDRLWPLVRRPRLSSAGRHHGVHLQLFLRPHRPVRAPQYMLHVLRREHRIGDSVHPHTRRKRVERRAHRLRRRAGDYVHPPATLGHRVRELLPASRTNGRIGWEVIADHEQAARVELRSAALLPERRRARMRAHNACSRMIDTNASARARWRQAIIPA